MAPSKAVVVVDRPMRAPSMHIQKPYLGKKLSKFSLLSLCQILFYLTKLLYAYVQCVYIVSAKYQIAPSKAVVGVDQPIKALSMHIQKPYLRKKLSKFSLLSFCQKNNFSQTPTCICLMCLYCIGKVSNCSIKSCGTS